MYSRPVLRQASSAAAAASARISNTDDVDAVWGGKGAHLRKFEESYGSQIILNRSQATMPFPERFIFIS